MGGGKRSGSRQVHARPSLLNRKVGGGAAPDIGKWNYCAMWGDVGRKVAGSQVLSLKKTRDKGGCSIITVECCAHTLQFGTDHYNYSILWSCGSKPLNINDD